MGKTADQAGLMVLVLQAAGLTVQTNKWRSPLICLCAMNTQTQADES